MEELELRQYWTIIRKRLGLVVLIPIIAAIISGLVSEFIIKPQYDASTTLLVNQKQTNATTIDPSLITASQELVKTYSDIIKSQTIERKVIANLNLPYTQPQLDSMVGVSSPDQSQVIQVTVTARDQALAAHIANSLASVFQERAQVLMNVQNVQIVDPALVASKPSPVKPNKKLNVAIAFILGLMVSLGIAFLLEYLDNRLRTDEDVQRYLQLPVLGNIMEYSEFER